MSTKREENWDAVQRLICGINEWDLELMRRSLIHSYLSDAVRALRETAYSLAVIAADGTQAQSDQAAAVARKIFKMFE